MFANNKVKPIFLLGYMGTGKTYIGAMLSKALGFEWIDSDREIEGRMNMTISQIFDLKGEAFFRDQERQLIHELKERNNLIISTGGGFPCDAENIEVIKEFGISFYLLSSIDLLVDRLWDERLTRPLINKMKTKLDLRDFVSVHLLEREKFYFQSNFIVDAQAAPAEVLKNIESNLTRYYQEKST